ncbi:MAG: Heme A synthase, cytochrome oxidase biogenesis protein Cox15-CtaA [uncultured Sphingomonadaceae bacterium]|uniref:Heme A synthase n=1 Tax=uncultured Sphingomonadaceae bacterium TaxID=169976 RepID=A0A6J4S2F9_9SPHN|nr:MAG: Heme A synthase, cytochrome oxidase biogenesis protein Cox15-CtaA [uncultured Sphingomonadaceae bacterium]
MNATAARAPRAPAPARPQPTARPLALARWLLAVAGLVVAMVIVGGITRLTESGLSITEWKPVTGAIPPLNAADWEEAFALYKATPEYQQVNRGMSLGDFKFIFFWEYIHRLLGRVIGLAFALPLAWFAWKRAIPRGYGWRLVVLLCLGGLQGAIGWWMVVSGLAQRTDVSHVRLAVHLLTALLILGGLVWTALDLRALGARRVARPVRMPTLAVWTFSVLALQLMFGAYVAGLDAGYAFNSWPKMGEEWFPGGTPMLQPWLTNLVDNPIVVQFVHRWLAWVVAGFSLLLAWRAARAGFKGAAHALAFLVLFQIGLGIATLLSGVELWVAVAHQGTAALLVVATALAAHRLGEARTRIVRAA